MRIAPPDPGTGGSTTLCQCFKIRRPELAERLLNSFFGEATGRLTTKSPGFSAPLLDLPPQPLEILESIVRRWQQVCRILNRKRAQLVEPPHDLGSEVR